MKTIKIMLMVSVALLLTACGSNKETLMVVADDYCGVNAPIAGVEFGRETELQPWGWAFDKSSGKVPEDISMQIVSEDKKNGLRVPLTRMSRPDVAKVFNLPIEMAGYSGKIDIKTLPPATYTVSVLQAVEGKIFICNSPSKIVLK